jgi:DNA-binding helix-turn-helix protein
MDEVTDFLYKYVLNNNPYIHEEDINNFVALNSHDLQITFKNGITEIYDTFTNTCKRVLNLEDSNKTDKILKNNFKRTLQIKMSAKWIDQDELARRIGTSQQMVSKYLTGKSVPGYLMLHKIANALDCNINDFYK